MEERKLNILIVHNYYKQPGGEGIVVDNEKNMLKENGHKVFLYARNNNEIDNYSIIKKILLPINYLFNIKTYIDIKKIIKQEKIDIIHIHNTINIISKSVYYAAIKCKVPIVQTVHNFRFLCPNGLFYRNKMVCEDCLNYGLKSAIQHKCYRNNLFETILSVINMKLMRKKNIFSYINFICLTEFNKIKLLEINRNKKLILKDSIFVKPHFILDKNLIELKNDRDNYYVCASRLDENKGIKFLFEAWKSIKDSILYICGSGDLLKWCQNFIKENNINNIVLVGNMEHNDLLELISKSKGLINPTRCYESFGLSIIEAYSVSTPVLVADFGNAGSLVKNGVTGYKYRYDDVNSFIENYKKLSNSHLYNYAYDEYLNNYTQEENYKQLINIYKQIINNYENT